MNISHVPHFAVMSPFTRSSKKEGRREVAQNICASQSVKNGLPEQP